MEEETIHVKKDDADHIEVEVEPADPKPAEPGESDEEPAKASAPHGGIHGAPVK